MTETPIIMTWPDHAQLTTLVEDRCAVRNDPDAEALVRLAGELARARLVAAQDVPADVVTMNTTAQVRDLDSNDVFAITLSWPDQADAVSARINVLAPLGMAILGCRVGQEIEWRVPGGHRRLRIEDVLFQPENGLPPEAG